MPQDIYAFTFPFSLEPGHKNLPREAAIALWQLLLPPHFPLLSDWCRFMEERGPKLVTRDTWTLLLQFARQIKPDLSNYDEDGASRAAPVSGRLPRASLTQAPPGAWPVIIDDFVEWIKAGKGK